MAFWTAALPDRRSAGAERANTARAEDPIVRQQLKWLRNGALLRLRCRSPCSTCCPTPSARFPAHYLKMSVLSLPLIPLTLAYAIVRYRLMDVDILFRRGYAYTLATLCVFWRRSTASCSRWAAWCRRTSRTWAIPADLVMLLRRVPVPADPQLDSGAARQVFLPRPLRLPPHAGGVRARAELGNRPGHHAAPRWATADADALDPAPGVLPGRGRRRRMAGGRIPAAKVHGRRTRAWPRADSRDLDLSFLDWKLPRAVPVLRAHPLPAGRGLASPGRLRCAHTIADLDLTYYLPCTVRGRTIAYLGVSRTDGRRIPFQRGRGTAAHAGRLRRHRHRERHRSTARCSARWKSTSG